MKTYGTNSEVIQAFVDGCEGPNRTGNGNIWFDNDTLYSYGTHFPLVHLNHQRIYLVNGDKYSVTTSSHQSKAQSALLGERTFTTSFSCLRNAGIDYKTVRVLHFTEDQSEYSSDHVIDPKSVPLNASVVMKKESDESKIASWHLAATAVLKSDDKYYICGMDENSYFVSELPCEVNTVNEAFEALKPGIVKELEAAGNGTKRQGEWFCWKLFDSKIAKQVYKELTPEFVLPRDDDSWGRPSGNPHQTTRGAFLKDICCLEDAKYLNNKAVIFSGAITHSEHRTLRVSTAKTPEIWQAAKNTALNSWSESGVD